MPRLFRVLMIEDDEGDARLTHEALKEAKLELALDVVDDGEKAMAYLRQQPPYQDRERPDLILLDLNLPRISGHEVLRQIRKDPAFKSLPVVVLTTSESDIDLSNSYSEGANCYVTKPVGFEQFSRVVQSISQFWFTIVSLPENRD